MSRPVSVVWHGHRQQAADLAGHLHLGWRPQFGLRAAAVTVYAPKYGTIRLVVTRNRHDAEVARRLGVSRQAASRWHARWRQGGRAGLAGPGR